MIPRLPTRSARLAGPVWRPAQARIVFPAAVCGLLTACGEGRTPVAASSATEVSIPAPTVAAVRLVFLGSTVRRPDLTPEQLLCAEQTGPTHAHPSWRSFEDAGMTPVGLDRYEVAFDDVPIDRTVFVTVWDQNWCEGARLGFVADGVLANGVRLQRNWSLDDQPGFAFSVDRSGRVRQ